MSLDELLKDPKDASPWKKQRAKLIRVSIGMGVALIALVAGAVLFFATKTHHPQATAPVQTESEAETLARLMRIRREASNVRRNLTGAGRDPAVVAATAGFNTRTGSGPDAQVISYDPGDGFAQLATAKADLYIPTGAVFLAQMLTPIKTSVARTFVMAETTHEFRMDAKRRIPSGSRLIGRSYFDPVLKGVVVEFDTVVFPNGIETAISALALSHNALPELEGLYFSNNLVTYGTALAFGFMSGFADAAREREFTLLGSQPQVSLSNQVLTGLSTASFQVAEQMLRDIQSRAIEYVVVPAGEQVFVALTRKYEIAQAQGAPK